MFKPIGLILTFCIGLASIQAQIPPMGYWEGLAMRDGQGLQVTVDIRSTSNGLVGTFSLPEIGVMDERLARIQNDGSEIEIVLPERGGNTSFAGNIVGAEIVGVWNYQGLSGPFRLVRKQLQPRNFREEEVHFQNGGIILAGNLLLPNGPGPHPAVVFVHGSGPARRDSSWFLAERFVRAGVAALIYDKRGAGDSTGDYRKSSFDDLAADVLAGVEMLRSRRDINHQEIGLHGTSQGGWVAPLAASRSKAVKFLILVSAPAETPAQTELHSVEANLRAQGFDEGQISDAAELTKLKIHFALTGQGWDDYATAVERASKGKWFSLTGAPRSRDHWSFETWRLIFGFDPVPVLEKISCPVLAIFGGRDTTFDVSENLRIMQTTLAPGIPRGQIHEAKFKVFPKADHSIIEFPASGEPFFWPKFADGYIDLTLDWLLRHVTPKI